MLLHSATNILTSRLFLNIRAAYQPEPAVPSDLPCIPRQAFGDRFLGNIGGPVQHRWLYAEFDDDDDLNLDNESPDDQTVSSVNNATLVPVVSTPLAIYLICRPCLTSRLRCTLKEVQEI